VFSWILRRGAWWPGVLTEAGVAVLLFGPLLLISRGIERALDTLREAQRHTEEHQQKLEERQEGLAEQQRRTESEVAQLAHDVADTQAAMRLTSEQLSDAVLSRIVQTRQEDAALFASVAEAPMWEAVLGSLMRARELDMIPVSGCRVSLFGADCYLRLEPEWTYPDRLNPDQEPDAIQLTLEFTDGTTRRIIFWEQAATPAEIVMRVAEAMQSLGCYPGDSGFKAGDIFRELGDLLQLAHRLATGEGGTVYPVRHIIQLCPPQWVIAEDGIYSIQPAARFHIAAQRFGEQDWQRHMQEKSWLDQDSFDDAFATAQLLQRNSKLAPPDPWTAEVPF
jgi:Sec-independent protein translocase protein TatA